MKEVYGKNTDLDWARIAHFFPHYLPETEGCEGYHNFGFNRKEQIRQIIMLPFAAVLTAWICSLI